MASEPRLVSIGTESRIIWPSGVTAADLHVAIDALERALSACEDPSENRSLGRVLNAVQNEYGLRKQAAITAATGGRRHRRRNVQ